MYPDRNRTGDPLILRQALNPLSHTSQDWSVDFIKIKMGGLLFGFFFKTLYTKTYIIVGRMQGCIKVKWKLQGPLGFAAEP